MPFMGGPNTCITNPRWRTAAILEKSKNCHISAAVQLISFQWSLALWHSSTLLNCRNITNLNFYKSKMAASVILKNWKCLSVTLVYCRQTVVWIKMKLGMEVGLGPRPHCVRWGPSSTQKGHSPQFLAHVYCGQRVAHLRHCWALVT